MGSSQPGWDRAYMSLMALRYMPRGFRRFSGVKRSSRSKPGGGWTGSRGAVRFLGLGAGLCEFLARIGD